MSTKWVFKIKSDGHDRVLRYMVRLVVCGYRQKFDRDYDLICGPVTHAESIRLVLSIALAKGYHLHQFDMKTVFHHGVSPPHQ